MCPWRCTCPVQCTIPGSPQCSGRVPRGWFTCCCCATPRRSTTRYATGSRKHSCTRPIDQGTGSGVPAAEQPPGEDRDEDGVPCEQRVAPADRQGVRVRADRHRHDLLGRGRGKYVGEVPVPRE